MSVHNFKRQVKHPLTDEIKKIPLTNYQDIPDIDDTKKYNWVQVGEDKYGRHMYAYIYIYTYVYIHIYTYIYMFVVLFLY